MLMVSSGILKEETGEARVHEWMEIEFRLRMRCGHHHCEQVHFSSWCLLM